MSSSISTLHNLFSHSGSKVCDPNHYSTLPLWKESTFCCPCLFRFCLPPPYCERQWQSLIFVFLVHQCPLCGKWMNEWMKRMEEWRDHTFRAWCAIGSGQQPSFMTILCAHTKIHDLYGGGGNPFSRSNPVGISTWDSQPGPAMLWDSDCRIHNRFWPQALFWQWWGSQGEAGLTFSCPAMRHMASCSALWPSVFSFITWGYDIALSSL